MDKFEQKKMKNKRPVKKAKYDCFINYIPEPISKFKDKFISHFITNTQQQTVYGRGKKLKNQKHKNDQEKKHGYKNYKSFYTKKIK